MSRQIRLMPVGGRPVPGVNPEIRPRALSLGYLPETVEKCRRDEISGQPKKKLDKTFGMP